MSVRTQIGDKMEKQINEKFVGLHRVLMRQYQ